MPQYERRLYEPSDEPRVFDGGEDDLPEDEGSRLPLLIVIALVVLASFVGVVWVAYTQGVQRGREDAPRVLAAEQGRTSAPRRRADPYAKLDIYKAPRPGAAASAVSPIVPQQSAPPVQSPPSGSVGDTPGAAAMAAAKGFAATNNAPPSAKPVISVPAKPMHNPQQSPASNGQATEARPATAAPKAITPPAAQPMPAKPVAAKAAQASPDPLPTSPGAATQGGYVLQIGSYTSEAEANASWQTYKRQHPAVAGYSPDIKSADLGNRGTWYRLRVGPFASLSAASAACSRLKAQGATCLPAKQ